MKLNYQEVGMLKYETELSRSRNEKIKIKVGD